MAKRATKQEVQLLNDFLTLNVDVTITLTLTDQFGRALNPASLNIPSERHQLSDYLFTPEGVLSFFAAFDERAHAAKLLEADFDDPYVLARVEFSDDVHGRMEFQPVFGDDEEQALARWKRERDVDFVNSELKRALSIA